MNNRTLFKKTSNFRIKSFLSIGIAVFIFSTIFGYLAPIQILELKTRDMLFDIRGEKSVEHSDIIIVEISQTADEEIPYQYPWPRYIYANLIENLNRAGVKAIGIDVIFDQPDRVNVQNDSLFAKAMAKYENVVLSGHINRQTRIGSGVSSESTSLVMPNPLLRNANPNPTGLVAMINDPDDFIRHYLIKDHAMGDEYYSLAFELVRLLPGNADILEQGQNLELGEYEPPIFKSNSMLLNYYGGERTFNYISLEEVIDDKDFETVTEMEAFEMNLFDDPEYGILQQEILKDKIVLVGATMPELHDIHSVPVRGNNGRMAMAGVEIHANALQAILDGNYLYHVSNFTHISLLLLFSLLIVGLTGILSFWLAISSILFILAGWIGASIYLFLSHKLILFYVSPAIAIVTAYGSMTAYQYFREEKEKKRIKGMFSSYVSPKLVEQMVSSEGTVGLGGEEKEITALFSDIANFSTLSEKLEPARLIELMNDYLEEMTRIIMEESGTLDKYIGDAVMAFYGAPVTLKDNAYRACITAIKMQKALDGIRNSWKELDENLPAEIVDLQIRIGVNTGKMVVGNMGSRQRFNYTILGDQVNIAARCESACKKYGVQTIITKATLDEADPERKKFLTRFLDNIRVKGRKEPVEIYELMGLLGEASPKGIRAVEQFHDATNLFYEQEWELAKEKFQKLVYDEQFISVTKSDSINPCRLYIQRCDELKDDSPGKDWDGVFDQASKI